MIRTPAALGAAAKVPAAVADKAEVLDLAVEEPGIEDVIRRIYAASRSPGRNSTHTRTRKFKGAGMARELAA